MRLLTPGKKWGSPGRWVDGIQYTRSSSSAPDTVFGFLGGFFQLTLLSPCEVNFFPIL